MDIYKLIFISCLVFILSFCSYLIVKNHEKVKAFILKLDNKLEKKFSKSNDDEEKPSNNEKNKKQKNKNSSEENKKDDVKLISYNSSSSEKEKDNKKNMNTSNSSNDKSNSKLKPNKSVEQIRPVMLPPNEEAEERDLKLLEMKKRPEMLEASTQKSLDFKYGSKQMASSKTEREFGENSKRKTRTSDEDDFISFSNKSDDNFNPLKRDVKKQYEDIKNFLDLPENKTVTNQKGVSYDGKNFRSVDKIDASIFNNPDTHYVDYRNMDKSQAGFKNLNNQPAFKSNSSLINNYNETINASLPYKSSPQNNSNNHNNLTANGDVMFTNTKYARNSGINNTGMPSFNLTDSEINDASQFNKNYELTKDEENIDLNKLPNNLKKMIIQNILDRKNYD